MTTNTRHCNIIQGANIYVSVHRSTQQSLVLLLDMTSMLFIAAAAAAADPFLSDTGDARQDAVTKCRFFFLGFQSSELLQLLHHTRPASSSSSSSSSSSYNLSLVFSFTQLLQCALTHEYLITFSTVLHEKASIEMLCKENLAKCVFILQSLTDRQTVTEKDRHGERQTD